MSFNTALPGVDRGTLNGLVEFLIIFNVLKTVICGEGIPSSLGSGATAETVSSFAYWIIIVPIANPKPKARKNVWNLVLETFLFSMVKSENIVQHQTRGPMGLYSSPGFCHIYIPLSIYDQRMLQGFI